MLLSGCNSPDATDTTDTTDATNDTGVSVQTGDPVTQTIPLEGGSITASTADGAEVTLDFSRGWSTSRCASASGPSSSPARQPPAPSSTSKCCTALEALRTMNGSGDGLPDTYRAQVDLCLGHLDVL